MNLKFGNVLTSKSVGTGPSSYEKRIYRAAVSQRLRNNDLYHLTGQVGFIAPETNLGKRVKPDRKSWSSIFGVV